MLLVMSLGASWAGLLLNLGGVVSLSPFFERTEGVPLEPSSGTTSACLHLAHMLPEVDSAAFDEGISRLKNTVIVCTYFIDAVETLYA